MESVSFGIESFRPTVANDETEKNEGIDLGQESPLNLFIQCFKKKYDISVNPNDIAIFV